MYVFLLDLFLSLGVSLAVVLYLRPMLRRVLEHGCAENGLSVDFWIRLTDLLMLLAPLIVVTFLNYRPHEELDQHLRRVLCFTLIGNVIGIAWTGRMIWNYMVLPRSVEVVEVEVTPKHNNPFKTN